MRSQIVGKEEFGWATLSSGRDHRSSVLTGRSRSPEHGERTLIPVFLRVELVHCACSGEQPTAHDGKTVQKALIEAVFRVADDAVRCREAMVAR